MIIKYNNKIVTKSHKWCSTSGATPVPPGPGPLTGYRLFDGNGNYMLQEHAFNYIPNVAWCSGWTNNEPVLLPDTYSATITGQLIVENISNDNVKNLTLSYSSNPSTNNVLTIGDNTFTNLDRLFTNFEETPIIGAFSVGNNSLRYILDGGYPEENYNNFKFNANSHSYITSPITNDYYWPYIGDNSCTSVWVNITSNQFKYLHIGANSIAHLQYGYLFTDNDTNGIEFEGGIATASPIATQVPPIYIRPGGAMRIHWYGKVRKMVEETMAARTVYQVPKIISNWSSGCRIYCHNTSAADVTWLNNNRNNIVLSQSSDASLTFVQA